MSKDGYEFHLFVCTNQKAKGACCQQKNMGKLKDSLKAKCRAEFGPRIRVNSSGCLGKCEQGGVAVLYPDAKWFFELTEESAEQITTYIGERMNK